MTTLLPPNCSSSRAEFPDTADAKKVDGAIASMAEQAAASKIQKSLSVGTTFPDFQVAGLGRQAALGGERQRQDRAD